MIPISTYKYKATLTSNRDAVHHEIAPHTLCKLSPLYRPYVHSLTFN